MKSLRISKRIIKKPSYLEQFHLEGNKDSKQVNKETKNTETDKFKTSPFAKKYKEELSKYEEYKEKLEALESANQVKSWKRGAISETVNLTYIFLGVIIGFSLCAVVMTPIIINSI